MTERWYNIQNKAGKPADVYIFDEIGTCGITAQEFITDIKDLKDTPINLRINSLGGDVFDGMAMYNVIKRREAKTTVYIEGIAASIATIIALGADEVVMAENSLFMIHNAWGGTMGESKDMRKTADTLDKITSELTATLIESEIVSIKPISNASLAFNQVSSSIISARAS